MHERTTLSHYAIVCAKMGRPTAPRDPLSEPANRARRSDFSCVCPRIGVSSEPSFRPFLSSCPAMVYRSVTALGSFAAFFLSSCQPCSYRILFFRSVFFCAIQTFSSTVSDFFCADQRISGSVQLAINYKDQNKLYCITI